MPVMEAEVHRHRSDHGGAACAPQGRFRGTEPNRGGAGRAAGSGHRFVTVRGTVRAGWPSVVTAPARVHTSLSARAGRLTSVRRPVCHKPFARVNMKFANRSRPMWESNTHHGLPIQERDMSGWAIAAMVAVDVYAVCFAVLSWAISTAPLVPASAEL
jgi:hypothetical protein